MAAALALSVGDALEAEHLPAELSAAPTSLREGPGAGASSGDDALRDRIVALLHEHHGNVTAVARVMGKAPAQVHRWMRKLGIDPDVYRTA